MHNNLIELMKMYNTTLSWMTSFFVEVDATCSDFDFGTALHIAASNLCMSAVKCLLELGANPAFRVSYIVLLHTHRRVLNFIASFSDMEMLSSTINAFQLNVFRLFWYIYYSKK